MFKINLGYSNLIALVQLELEEEKLNALNLTSHMFEVNKNPYCMKIFIFMKLIWMVVVGKFHEQTVYQTTI